MPERRQVAFGALAEIAQATGMSVTPVSTRDADDAALVVIKVGHALSLEAAERVKRYWKDAVDGTPLQGVRAVVIDGDVDIEIIRRTS